MQTKSLMISSLLLICMAAIQTASAEDRREGYYYPPVISEEVFIREIGTPPSADRAVRTNFINELTAAQLAAPDNPRFSIFAKGRGAEHMVIIELDDEIFKTLYRARAQLAQLTSNARGTEFFRQNELHFVATWFDLAKMLGFEDIVISDGEKWSHRITLK